MMWFCARARFVARHSLRCRSTMQVCNTLTHGSTSLPLDVPLKWYVCGPTVYDVSHIGHARTYICTDYIRRVLTDYFHAEVNFAMGMTDIDDKIIDKAISESASWIDIARKYEDAFLVDLEVLNIKPPHAILRVSEHVPDIISYIQTIVTNNHAYTTPNGVYFHVPSLNHTRYGKLGNIPTTTSELEPVHKKDPRDFALWKAAKPNEPFWDSPWGPGRPGWHIECSAMTHSYFGAAVDIHSGGIDLKFPHHTNEIAQCEAHNCCDHWVKYWFHTGHLYIEGQKMSKSLKNFISIQEYLQSGWSKCPALDLRLFFLSYKYHATLHLSRDKFNECIQIRHKVEYLHRMLQMCRTNKQRAKRPTPTSRLLNERVMDARKTIHAALLNDFDTPLMMRTLSDVVQQAILYVETASSTNDSLESPEQALNFVVDMLGVVGADFSYLNSTTENVSISAYTNSIEVIDAFSDFRSKVRSTTMLSMKQMKQATKSGDDHAFREVAKKCSSDIMTLCDWARDEVAPSLGVEFHDFSDKSTWKPRKNG